MSNIHTNLDKIQSLIATYERKYRRKSGSVSLLAVSKQQSIESIKEAHAAGQMQFGENYVQEALEKIASLKHYAIEWHFIGQIQSNKAKIIAEHFSWVQSVGRLEIAEKLNEYRGKNRPALNICLQVNISQDPNKAGFSLSDIPKISEHITRLPHLNLRGLMTIPSIEDTNQHAHEVYATLKQNFDALKKRFPTIDTLSMGMSNDYEAAIAEGSTLVRIGTAIFGQRS